jgi:hypothetical protein
MIIEERRAAARALFEELRARNELRWAIVLGDELYGPSVAELVEKLDRLERNK